VPPESEISLQSLTAARVVVIGAGGLGCAVHEDAVLWHLERQSQGGSGNSWRHNLTLVNGWSFARRWGHLFPESAPDAPAGAAAVLRLA